MSEIQEDFKLGKILYDNDLLINLSKKINDISGDNSFGKNYLVADKNECKPYVINDQIKPIDIQIIAENNFSGPSFGSMLNSKDNKKFLSKEVAALCIFTFDVKNKACILRKEFNTTHNNSEKKIIVKEMWNFLKSKTSDWNLDLTKYQEKSKFTGENFFSLVSRIASDRIQIFYTLEPNDVKKAIDSYNKNNKTVHLNIGFNEQNFFGYYEWF